MGITGLIPFLSKASKKSNVSEFSGGTVAIDAYCWLHKGAFSCADKLIMGQSSDAYVKYCMKLVHMLLAANIKPILVFDGRHLPAKAETESKRREQRESNKRRAAELMRMGKHYEGKNLLRRSLDISHEMALEVIKQCQAENVDCIVAPYEADAQLAYLNISGIADVVITEDSDLTLFGCTKIFFKMDINGNGLLVEQDRIHLAMGVRAEHFDMDKFRHMCILSGCDYLPSLPGIGLSKACKFILKNTDCDIYNALSRIASYLNMKSLVVTKEYRDGFLRALVTFKHQMVYCPIKRQQVRLYSPPSHVTDEQLRHAGMEVDEDLALQLALGNYDPFKLKKLHDFNPDDPPKRIQRTNSWTDRSIAKHASIWSENYKKREITSPKEKTLKPFFPDTAGQVLVYKTTIVEKATPKKRSFDDIEDIDYVAMYSQEPKKKIETTEKTETTEEMSIENTSEEKEDEVISPILSRRTRNPFAKGSDGFSPSLLTRTRRRTRLNIFTPTVIDSTVVEESKFFAKSSTSELIESELKSSERANLCEIEQKIEGKENINENKLLLISEETETEKELQIDNADEFSKHQLNKNENILSEGEKENSKNLFMEDEIFSETSENNCEDSVLDKSIGISSINLDSQIEGNSSKGFENTEGSLIMNTQELLSDLKTPRSESPDSESEYSVNTSSIETIRSGLFQWSSKRTLGVKKLPSQHRLKEEHQSKKKSRTSFGSRKSTPSQGQQSLLNMFGFQKKSSLKH